MQDIIAQQEAYIRQLIERKSRAVFDDAGSILSGERWHLFAHEKVPKERALKCELPRESGRPCNMTIHNVYTIQQVDRDSNKKTEWSVRMFKIIAAIFGGIFVGSLPPTFNRMVRGLGRSYYYNRKQRAKNRKELPYEHLYDDDGIYRPGLHLEALEAAKRGETPAQIQPVAVKPTVTTPPEATLRFTWDKGYRSVDEIAADVKPVTDLENLNSGARYQFRANPGVETTKIKHSAYFDLMQQGLMVSEMDSPNRLRIGLKYYKWSDLFNAPIFKVVWVKNKHVPFKVGHYVIVEDSIFVVAGD